MPKNRVLGTGIVTVGDDDVLLARLSPAKSRTTLLDNVSVPSSSEIPSSNSVQLDLDAATSLALTGRVQYDPSASQGVVIKVYTSPDAQNYDDDPFTTFQPSFSSGDTVQKTVPVDPSARYVRVTAENLDGSQSAFVTVEAIVQ